MTATVETRCLFLAGLFLNVWTFTITSWKKCKFWFTQGLLSHAVGKMMAMMKRDPQVTAWPDRHWEDQEGVEALGFALNWLWRQRFLSGTCSGCSDEAFVMPGLNFSPVVGHGSSSARDSGRQQKCVAAKCTWHFSSTIQLLSELATCVLERKGKWGAPKVLSLEFANTRRDRENQPSMAYKRQQETSHTSFPATWVMGLQPWTVASSLVQVRGWGWPANWVVSLRKDGPSMCSALFPGSQWVLKNTVIITSP